MSILAEENFPKPIVEALRVGRYDVLWAHADVAGTSNVSPLDRAESQATIVLTLDRDVQQIAAPR